MSDTPKTDEAVRNPLRGVIYEVVHADFARAQERRISELEASLDAALPSWRESGGDIERSALAMERRRVIELENMLRRCEWWFGTHVDGGKMQEAVRALLPKG